MLDQQQTFIYFVYMFIMCVYVVDNESKLGNSMLSMQFDDGGQYSMFSVGFYDLCLSPCVTKD